MKQTSVQASPPDTSNDPDFVPEPSLVRGGPFYRIQEAIHLVTPQRWNLGRRIAFAIGAGWGPLFVFKLVTKPHTLVNLLTDYTINVRLLIAIPVLLAGQILMENTFRMIIHQIREADLLSSLEQVKMDHTIARLLRLRDSIIAEVIIAVIAYLHFTAMSPPTLELSGFGRCVIQVWAFIYHWLAGITQLVSQLLYQFLLGISALPKWFLDMLPFPSVAA